MLLQNKLNAKESTYISQLGFLSYKKKSLFTNMIGYNEKIRRRCELELVCLMISSDGFRQRDLKEY